MGWLLAESRGNRIESELPGLLRRSSITFYGYCFRIRIGTVLSHTCRQREAFLWMWEADRRREPREGLINLVAPIRRALCAMLVEP